MEGMDQWSVAAVLDALWAGQAAAVAAARGVLPALAEAVAAAVPRLRAGGTLAYAGAGTSGRLGALDAAELPPTFGIEPPMLLLAGGMSAMSLAAEGAEDDAQAGTLAAQALNATDVLIAIAASGGTPFTVAAARAARARGCLVVAIANAPGSTLLDAADHGILLATGAEPLAGSTRMNAGTAQLVALKLFSTALMIALGHSFGGRMVDMRPTNAKLRARAVRMLCELTGCDDIAATAALAATGGSVKRAVLVVHGLDSDDATALLTRHDGHLRPALAEVLA